MSVGNNIRKIANQKKITPYKIAKETGISNSYLSDLINNKCTNPSLDILKKIAAGLGVSVEEII